MSDRIVWQEVEVAPGIYGPVCPICGCLVVRELKQRHEQWHFDEPPKDTE